jgi:ketosteroid isomerase-like protein
MVSANLDLVHSIFANWERGDFHSSEWAEPEIEYVIADGPTPGRWSGLTGMREGGRTFLSAWEDWSARPEEYRELDDERVLVLCDPRGRGKTSGVELQTARAKAATLLRIRSGKVVALTWYFDRDRALADLGIVSEAAPAAVTPPQRANVETARAGFEAFNRRDPEAFIRDARVSADFEWRPFMAAGVEAGVYRGHDGVREWFETVDEMFETISAEVSDVRDAGERVVVLATLRARGRGSGVPVESPLGIVLEVDADGLARCGIAFTTHADALAHAGLER